MKKIILFIIFYSLVILNDFTNVQVLEIKTRSEIKKYMKSISKDLGVKCAYCHDMDDKSIDTPDKEIAREMIILTRQINNFLQLQLQQKDEEQVVITCWTCHKGKTDVEKIRPEIE